MPFGREAAMRVSLWAQRVLREEALSNLHPPLALKQSLVSFALITMSMNQSKKDYRGRLSYDKGNNPTSELFFAHFVFKKHTLEARGERLHI